MPDAPKTFQPPGSRTRKQARAGFDKGRASATKRGYGADWRRLREWVLVRRPLCEHCQREGQLTVATEVDHIKGFLRADGSLDHKLRLDPQNLQALCKPCHSRKTASEVWGQGKGVGG